MISSHHYGATKGAVYLADLLKADPTTRRKVDRLMHLYNERLADILFSNMTAPTKLWCIMVAMQATTQSFQKFPAPVNTVAQNVVKGAYKESLRTIAARGEKTRRGEKYSTFFKDMPAYEDRGKSNKCNLLP